MENCCWERDGLSGQEGSLKRAKIKLARLREKGKEVRAEKFPNLERK